VALRNGKPEGRAIGGVYGFLMHPAAHSTPFLCAAFHTRCISDASTASMRMNTNNALWRRAAAWAGQVRARPDMTLLWTCCGTPTLGTQALLGHAGRHELRLASCSHCGAQWLYLMQANDWLPLTRDDAAALRATHGTARAALLARWAEDDEQADWRRRKQRAKREAEE
jgi:hypothetical protein